MFCKYCGTEIDDDSKVCSNCHKELEPVSVKLEKKESETIETSHEVCSVASNNSTYNNNKSISIIDLCRSSVTTLVLNLILFISIFSPWIGPNERFMDFIYSLSGYELTDILSLAPLKVISYVRQFSEIMNAFGGGSAIPWQIKTMYVFYLILGLAIVSIVFQLINKTKNARIVAIVNSILTIVMCVGIFIFSHSESGLELIAGLDYGFYLALISSIILLIANIKTFIDIKRYGADNIEENINYKGIIKNGFAKIKQEGAKKDKIQYTFIAIGGLILLNIIVYMCKTTFDFSLLLIMISIILISGISFLKVNVKYSIEVAKCLEEFRISMKKATDFMSRYENILNAIAYIYILVITIDIFTTGISFLSFISNIASYIFWIAIWRAFAANNTNLVVNGLSLIIINKIVHSIYLLQDTFPMYSSSISVKIFIYSTVLLYYYVNIAKKEKNEIAQENKNV
ncbi:zinc ribbon domain-containing protein [Abyssisolibacter fermentans]|uniref:zinc ribbon domain-containing protein n=1 Tax=Abyssisolibacter fermentans TaxID=1766203 RepID=UPI00082D9EAA|nr:zinc ribbon domain-containing protein [Abyssisolibacter fermentans]